MKLLRSILFPALVSSCFLFSGCAIHKKNSLEELSASRNIDPIKIEVYEALIKNGLDWEILTKVSDYHVDEIYWGLKSKRFPKYLFKTEGMDNEEYSKKAASKDLDFEKGEEFAREYIKKKLSYRNHLSRTDTDYSEDFSQVDSIYNKEMLFLIKRYIDFFDNKKNWTEIKNLFRDDEERGGHILDGKKDYSLIEIEQKSLLNKEKSYLLPVTSYYINKIGDFHTHPFSESNFQKNYAGPSGISKFNNCFIGTRSDFCVQRKMSNINPYTINVVISQIKSKKNERAYNVDIYFQDMIKIYQSTFQKEKIAVLDLGIWNFKEE